MRHSFLAACVLFCLVTGSARQARAEFVVTMTGDEDTQISGAITYTGANAPIGSEMYLAGFDSSVFTINGHGIDGHAFADIRSGGMVTGYTVGTLGITYATTGTERTTFITDIMPGIGWYATFDITYTSWFISFADPMTIQVAGTVRLVGSSSTLYDWSGFAESGAFMAHSKSKSDLNHYLFTGEWNGQRPLLGAFIWEMDAASPTATPEPSSLAILGSGAAWLGAWWAWRRRTFALRRM